MSTDERTMQVPECIIILSSAGNEQEKKTASNRTKFNASQLEILKRHFAENPLLEGERKERVAKEANATPLQTGTWFQNRRARLRRQAQRKANGTKSNNGQQLQIPPNTRLQLQHLEASLRKRKEGNPPCSVRGTAESDHPVSAANFIRGVNGHGSRGHTTGTSGTGPRSELNNGHLGAACLSSGADLHPIGSFLVHSQAGWSGARVHLKQDHLEAGLSSSGADSLSLPLQPWTNGKLCSVTSTLSHTQSIDEASTANSLTNVGNQYAPEPAPTKKAVDSHGFNVPGTLPPANTKLSVSAQPAAQADPNIGAGGDRGIQYQQTVYDAAPGGAHGRQHGIQGHQVAVSLSPGSDFPSLPEQPSQCATLALIASMPSSPQTSSREVEFADMMREMPEQIAPEVATTGQGGVVQDYNLLRTHPLVSAELSYPAEAETLVNLNVGAVGDRGEQTSYGAAPGGAQADEQVGHSHQFAVPPSSGPDLPSILQRWERANLLEHLDHLAQKFKHMADIHDEWTRGKEEMLQIQDFRQCRLNEIKDLKKKHEVFESDLVAHQDSVKRIAAIAQELNALGYHESASLNARCQLICDQWERLRRLTQKRRSALEEAERVLEKIDHLHLEFAKRVATFDYVMDGAREYLVDMFIVHTMEDIQRLMDAQEHFKQILGGAEKEYKALVGLAEEAQAIASQYQVPGGVKNPYTTLTPQVITGKLSKVKQLVPKRDQVLQAELMRQQSNERLRRKFAEKANVVGPWIEQQMAALASFGMGMQGAHEEQLKRLHEYEQAAAQYQPHLEELEGTHQEVQEAKILENRYTHYTMETLRVSWEQLVTRIHRCVNNITQVQLYESGWSFNQLEKNRTARLNPEEFKSCQGDANYSPIMNIVEPNNTSYDHSVAFVGPTTQKSTDEETDEQIINCMRTVIGDKPYTTADELRRQLSPKELEYCLQRMPAYKGHDAVPGALDYKSFSTKLYGKSSL